MASLLQVFSYSPFRQSPYAKCLSTKKSENTSFTSAFRGRELCLINEGSSVAFEKKRGLDFRVYAMSSSSSKSRFKMNLNEYMVTLERPLGIRFALSVDGKVFVHSLKKGVSIILPHLYSTFI